MGCVPSKIIYSKLESSKDPSKFHFNPSEGIYYHNEQDPYIKSRTLEAIKKCDLLRFQQVLLQYSIKPSEILTSKDQRKGLLHALAEYNFADGMALILDNLAKVTLEDIPCIINARDAMGDTCLNLCATYEAFQTMEILLRSEYIDPSIKNYAGKTAFDIALERESPCAKILSIYLTGPKKAKIVGSPGINTLSPLMSQGSTQIGSSSGFRKEIDYNIESTESPLTALDTDKETIFHDFFFVKLDQIKLKTQSKLFVLLQSLREKETWFSDEEFPQENDSIVANAQFLEYFEGHTTFHWEKPQDFMGKASGNIKIFDRVEVNDISKSPIAGCDVYSVLATMTEYPQRLLKVFTTTEINKHGAYSVNFTICGVPIEVVVDDYFPCVTDKNELAFSKPKDNELWFLLLEKAIAKLYGSFIHIEGIHIMDGFELITGMPSAQFSLKTTPESQLFDLLTDCDQRNYMIAVGNHLMPGLTKNRHFSVISTSEVGDMKMIKLRLQYGDDGWRWKFTEKTKKWTKDFKEKIKYFENEKDCYYLEIKEMIEQFDVVTVCYYHDNWDRKQINVRSDAKEEMFFEINVEKTTEAIISLHQKYPGYTNEGPEYDISPAELLIIQDCGDNSLRLIGSNTDESFVGKVTTYASDKVRINLKEGRYIVRAKVYWVDKGNHEFTLSTFSSYPLNVKEIKREGYSNIMERAFLDVGSRSHRQFRFNYDCFFASGWSGRYLWVIAINNGEKTWNLDIVFEKMVNLKIKKKYRDNNIPNVIKLKITGEDKKVAIVKRLSSEDVNLKWKFEQSWE